MNRNRVIVIFTFAFLPGLQLLAQGCSDAGFCTLNSTKPFTWDSIPGPSKLNSLKIGFAAGRADFDITILSSYVEYSSMLGEHVSVDLKVTSLAQLGPDYKTFGLSDAFITGSYKWFYNSAATLGLKIPFNKSNNLNAGNPLPHDYQSSLGTFDFIAGYGFSTGKLQWVVAGQIPFTQNKNQFLAPDSGGDAFSFFPSTRNFKRKPDALLRLSYPISLKNNWTFTPGLLPIYHIGKDKFTDETLREGYIKGSAGLTLNATVYFNYQMKNGNRLEFNAGLPLIARETRPDGLTRKFIATIEYKIRF